MFIDNLSVLDSGCKPAGMTYQMKLAGMTYKMKPAETQ
jgi:hypothetical protein